MTDQKCQLEKMVAELTSVYSEFLTDLNSQYQHLQELREEFEKREHAFTGSQILADCVKARLDQAKKLLNAVYNNEDCEQLSIFKFIPEMIVKNE